MKECKVVEKLYEEIKQGRLPDLSPQVFMDSHVTNKDISGYSEAQRFVLQLEGRAVYPDLTGRFSTDDSLFAIEVKGNGDFLQGIAQAEMYQFGFHAAYLAYPVEKIPPVLVSMAIRKNIGLIEVGDTCTLVFQPTLSNPQKRYGDAMRKQFDTAISFKMVHTFGYNRPTHYLFWLDALDSASSYSRDEMRTIHSAEGMSKESFWSAVRGGMKLGILADLGGQYALTEVGKAAQDSIDLSHTSWKEIHAALADRLLTEVHAQAAGVLRLLLMYDERNRLIVQALGRLREKGSVSYLDIVKACDELDHAITVIHFFDPKSLPVILDDLGRIVWDRVDYKHLRQRIDYQYKSIIMHAGFIQKSPLKKAPWVLK